jgi:hypothetical protein
MHGGQKPLVHTRFIFFFFSLHGLDIFTDDVQGGLQEGGTLL